MPSGTHLRSSRPQLGSGGRKAPRRRASRAGVPTSARAQTHREVTTNTHGLLRTATRPAGSATMYVMKKQMVGALVLVLLIPVVVMTGGFLFSLINPEWAA